ncbi:phosphoric diester hydrolase [Spatholobus suberectus]|nr:phosphoric diester hydrolase [Spatholobus suberectus]
MGFLSRLRKMLFYSLEKLERMYSPWIISIQSLPLKHLQYALANLTPRLLVNDCQHKQIGRAAGWNCTNSTAAAVYLLLMQQRHGRKS